MGHFTKSYDNEVERAGIEMFLPATPSMLFPPGLSWSVFSTILAAGFQTAGGSQGAVAMTGDYKGEE